jgi:hypothetical protein
MVVRSNERGPKGEKGDPGIQGPQGIPGPRGYDGVIQYRAGTGINISPENIITATGDATAAWGGIQGNINSQTDLQNALNAKQDVMADFTGANGVVGGTSGKVPAPAATDNVKFLKGDGTWSNINSATLTMQSNGVTAGTYNGSTNKTINIVSPVKVGEVLSQPTDVAYVDTVNIVDEAVTDAKIDWSSTSLGEVINLPLASGVTLPVTAQNSTNVVLSTGSTVFSGGVYILAMPSVMVTLSNGNYQANVSYRIDGNEWTIISDWAYFGSNTVLSGNVSFSSPMIINNGIHTIDIGFGTNDASKSITVGANQAIKATLTKVGY